MFHSLFLKSPCFVSRQPKPNPLIYSPIHYPLVFVGYNLLHSLVGHLAASEMKVRIRAACHLPRCLTSKGQQIEIALSISFATAADVVVTIALCWKLTNSGTGVRR
jgi:hypothetical protein